MKRIVIGMSGGVDSSVAALLLKEQGYDVIGIFMQNWQADNDDPYCTATQDLTDARTVCDRLSIPLQTVNFSQEYWDNVFQHFLDDYAKGRTPNPDVLCNQEIKFKAFLNYALTLGADYIATGHYARCHQFNDHYYLLRGYDQQKDQTYFLYTLGQKQLSHCLFPIGSIGKQNVRDIARKAGFANHAKKDSTGICFIGERKFKDFLSEYLLAEPGNIETTEGKVIGQHDGLLFYTLGQRQGLGIGGYSHALEAPWYVLEKDIERNTLIVGQQSDHPLLMKNTLTCRQLNWIYDEPPLSPLKCTAKIRYRQTDQACTIKPLDHDVYEVKFKSMQRAITAGQSVVFYKDDICLGGAVID